MNATSRRRYRAPSRSDKRPMSLPPKRTLPLSATSKPTASMSNVVLPEPLGPYSAANSPDSIVNETPSTARTTS